MHPNTPRKGCRAHALTGFLALLAVFTLAPASARAASLFITVNGTIFAADGPAYTIGENVSFTFTTNPSLGQPYFLEEPFGVIWNTGAGLNPDNPFSDITGSGLTGQWTVDSGQWTGANYYSLQGASAGFGSDYLRVCAEGNTGLFKNGAEISRLDMRAYLPLGTFPTPWPPVENVTPANLFPSGTYTSFNAAGLQLVDNNNYYYQVEITSLTFDSVPEPSGALLLIGGLGATALRRRRA